MPSVLVILSGCGVMDGSEIHESVLTLRHLDRLGAAVTFAAPDVDQAQVINHLTGAPMVPAERRNVRIESARIARGPVADLAQVRGGDFEAVILPGGFGAAKNLCSFATQGERCEVHPEVARVLREAHAAGRPIGLLCIAPAIGARVFPGCAVTIGGDPATAAKLTAMGARHESRAAGDICVDEANRIVSTPAYMSAKRLSEVDEGIGRLVEKTLALARSRPKAVRETVSHR
jgi:enhancing lycopene biosynthesis protein 2